MKKLAFAAGLALLAAPAGWACTSNDLHEKMSSFTERYRDLATKNPNKVRELVPRIQGAMERYRQAAAAGKTDYADICKLYDEMNAELDKEGA